MKSFAGCARCQRIATVTLTRHHSYRAMPRITLCPGSKPRLEHKRLISLLAEPANRSVHHARLAHQDDTAPAPSLQRPLYRRL